MSILSDLYDARVAQGTLKDDPAQRAVLPAFERVRVALQARPEPKAGLRSLFGGKSVPEPVTGLYLWGGVGRGKSMVMDLFYESVNAAKKRRVHFHAFMQEIHGDLHEVRKTGVNDAIRPVAEAVAAQVDLLCFDEMQITDITDAMIVGRLFERLLAAGVAIVTTSNRPPKDLYRNGLNRQLFVPFIELLEARMEVRELAAEVDYRQHRLSGNPVYFWPLGPEARAQMDAVWDDLSGPDAAPLRLIVQSREVALPQFSNGVARAGFYELCGRPLGPADYLAIAGAARVLMVDDIPCLSRSNFNEAKRFVTLVDALYEGRVRLICSAADRPESLYLEGEGSFEFERTASRLREMTSEGWGRSAG